MRSYRYLHYDVFTDHLFGGNQLAVVLDGRGLTTPTMQAIAKEMNFAEHAVLVVEPRRRHQRDEKLAAVGIRPAVGHRQDAGLAVPERRPEFVAEVVAGTAGALAQRIAALNHEIRDHAVEDRAVEVGLLHSLARTGIGPLLRSVREPREVRDGVRRLRVEQPRREVAFARRKMRV